MPGTNQTTTRSVRGVGLPQQTEARTEPDKENLIEDWLDESSCFRRTSAENEPPVLEALVNMPRSPPIFLTSPGNSLESTISTSRKSEAAFTENQERKSNLLVDVQFGRDFAVPDQETQFSFPEIEFRSQATNGTHDIATDQAAGTGAIALSGNLELIRRSFGLEFFDYEGPLYFSISMDNELARINVHWLRAAAEGGQHSFHIEGLSKHLQNDANGIRAIPELPRTFLTTVPTPDCEHSVEDWVNTARWLFATAGFQLNSMLTLPIALHTDGHFE
ncbi:uncharacterized protein PV06_08301 [Exophiala oligosperma]|uniref:DUF7924 domain-containing protein n=1 Tax=Exophiala oligosperma TaxID=215243 RepID=A0A0D2BQ99_9EURO|nr:uncharacterized protein PV06_08301 [Exophiala oligosperma]KIW39712.1 hypothetical protein PV06_08301 [Exophiala oligosperma]